MRIAHYRQYKNTHIHTLYKHTHIQTDTHTNIHTHAHTHTHTHTDIYRGKHPECEEQKVLKSNMPYQSSRGDHLEVLFETILPTQRCIGKKKR